MIATLTGLGRLFWDSFRWLTIKDRSGHPRWIWTGFLLAVVGAFVAVAFLAGVVFRGTNAFDRIKTQVQLALAGETVDPAQVWAELDDDALSLTWRAFETNNKTLEKVTIPIGQFFGSGGSIVEVGERLVFVAPKGRIGYLDGISGTGEMAIGYVDGKVPMRLEEFEQSEISQLPMFNRNWLRTMDSLVVPKGDGRYDFYVTHHRYVDECFAFTLSGNELVETGAGLALVHEEWTEVFAAQPCPEMKTTGNLYSGQRDGGRMAIAPDGKLLVTIGDFDFDGDNSYISAPMNPDYDFGKIFEIDLETGEAAPYAIGMRNPQGLTVTHDGLIFTSEHGPNGGDEVNHITRGANYGWPDVTLGMSYGFPRRPWPANPIQGRHDGPGFTAPVYAFVPSIGIGATMEVTSPLHPDWHGDLLVASLENQGLYRLRRRGEEIIYAERTEMGERMRDMAQLASGEIALLTDSARIILIRPRAPLPEDGQPEAPKQMTVAGFEGVRSVAAELAAENASLGIHPGRLVFQAKCSTCHSIHTDDTVVGPTLYRVAGRKVGAIDGYPYSDALSGRSEEWTEERLRRYLSDPDAEFSGSYMARVPLTFPEYLHVAWWITNCTSGRDRPECHTDG